MTAGYRHFIIPVCIKAGIPSDPVIFDIRHFLVDILKEINTPRLYGDPTALDCPQATRKDIEQPSANEQKQPLIVLF
jgi:hypothetical protein